VFATVETGLREDIILYTASSNQASRRKQQASGCGLVRRHRAVFLVVILYTASTLKMETVYFSETLVTISRLHVVITQTQ
jgi:hypothetical protein